MQVLLQVVKILLIALSAMFGVFFLHMIFGASMHAHDMGAGKLFASAGLGVLAGFVAAVAAALFTFFGESPEPQRLKRLNLILLIVFLLLAVLGTMSVFSGSRRALTNLLSF